MGWSEARGPRPRGAVAAFFVVLIVGAPVQGQENPATQLDLPRIEVIGTTPLRASACLPSRFRPMCRRFQPTRSADRARSMRPAR